MKQYPIIKPLETFKNGALTYQLDVRDVGDFLGDELGKVIYESLKAYTQSPIIKPLPDWLILTHRQFVSILPYTAEMMYTEDRFYKTPFNVMEIEVHIDDDTVREGEVVETFDPEVLKAGNAPGLVEGGNINTGSRWAR